MSESENNAKKLRLSPSSESATTTTKQESPSSPIPRTPSVENLESFEIEQIPVAQTTDVLTSGADHLKYNTWRVHSNNNPAWHDEPSVFVKKNKNLQFLMEERFKHHNVISLPETVGKSDISLTKQEHSIFQLLLDVNNHFKLGTTFRVAGGWVRNKLLKLPGDDIDIALDNMMGAQFAEYVVRYQKMKGLESRHVGVIKANPEQSKHLESATTHIHGESIDFVNLRCEEYAENSRIPSHMQLGTPKQDALRRDLTINTLFYNVNTEVVEDWTRRGIEDLRRGIVRTPLPSKQTFLDDPLRVLRAVRFASQYNFLVVDEIMEAARDPEIKKALGGKVSRERVGIELLKMMKGADPVGALALMQEMNILDVVFTVSNPPAGSKKKQLREYQNPTPIVWTPEQMQNAFFRVRAMIKLVKKYHLHGEDKAGLILAAFLSPTFSEKQTQEQVKDIVENVMCTSLKQNIKLAQEIASLIYYGYKLNTIIPPPTEETDLTTYYQELLQSEKKLDFGRWIRGAESLYKRTLMLWSVLSTKGDEFTEIENLYVDGHVKGECMKAAISHLHYDKLIEMRTVLNGQEIAKLLDLKPGKVIGLAVDDLLSWQIVNFETATREAGTEYILSRKSKYTN